MAIHVLSTSFRTFNLDPSALQLIPLSKISPPPFREALENSENLHPTCYSNSSPRSNETDTQNNISRFETFPPLNYPSTEEKHFTRSEGKYTRFSMPRSIDCRGRRWKFNGTKGGWKVSNFLKCPWSEVGDRALGESMQPRRGWCSLPRDDFQSERARFLLRPACNPWQTQFGGG